MGLAGRAGGRLAKVDVKMGGGVERTFTIYDVDDDSLMEEATDACTCAAAAAVKGYDWSAVSATARLAVLTARWRPRAR